MLSYNFEQKSPEWFAIRKGKMTASHAQAPPCRLVSNEIPKRHTGFRETFRM